MQTSIESTRLKQWEWLEYVQDWSYEHWVTGIDRIVQLSYIALYEHVPKSYSIENIKRKF